MIRILLKDLSGGGQQRCGQCTAKINIVTGNVANVFNISLDNLALAIGIVKDNALNDKAEMNSTALEVLAKGVSMYRTRQNC